MAVEQLEQDDMQALILDGFAPRPHARYALREIVDPTTAKSWLANIFECVVTAGSRRGRTGLQINLAFTFEGLEKLGLSETSGFLLPFREGMLARGPRELGDTNVNDWEWGRQSQSLHMLLMLFSEEGRLDEDWKQIEADLGGWSKPVIPPIDGRLSRTEQFGFLDGISQPYIEGSNTSRRPSGDEARADIVKPGEFILGYLNEADTLPTTPTIPDALDPGNHLSRRPTEPGRRDFGRNGTYLVLRQLQQNVDEFNEFLVAHAPDDAARRLLAAKMIGRWPSGAPLVKAPDADREALGEDNDFAYHESDPLGFACPVGAHIRRANPRDSLAEPARGVTPEMALRETRRHRLIRRGRVYGDAAEGQGLMFLCLNANIQDQFEFVQHSWINSPRFGGLDRETDPLIGPRDKPENCAITIPSPKGKQRIEGLARFVAVKGGAYFFLPGIRALKCLANL